MIVSIVGRCSCLLVLSQEASRESHTARLLHRRSLRRRNSSCSHCRSIARSRHRPTKAKGLVPLQQTRTGRARRVQVMRVPTFLVRLIERTTTDATATNRFWLEVTVHESVAGYDVVARGPRVVMSQVVVHAVVRILQFAFLQTVHFVLFLEFDFHDL